MTKSDDWGNMKLDEQVKWYNERITELEKQVAVLIHESADSDQYINQLEQRLKQQPGSVASQEHTPMPKPIGDKDDR